MCGQRSVLYVYVMINKILMLVEVKKCLKFNFNDVKKKNLTNLR